jgi:tRNA1(Val) A37 N6-methylase TrmN6
VTPPQQSRAVDWPVDARCDVLTRTLRVWQRAAGHKAASDDLLLADVAARARPAARRCLDLGTGKGTVALLLSARLPNACLVGVEAYTESHALALRNVEENGLVGRFEVRLGDLRDPAVLADQAPFDLVTGAPPFMPPGSGPPPRDPQRAVGRFEVRGGVEAYAETAARHLAADGACIVLMDGAGGARAERALTSAGLSVTSALAVLPRPGRPPTYHVVTATFAATTSAPARETLVMRRETGDGWSDAFAALRRRLDLPGS